MNALTVTIDRPRPGSLAWLRKAYALVSARIVPCPACEQPMLQGQRCGSCGHTKRVSVHALRG